MTTRIATLVFSALLFLAAGDSIRAEAGKWTPEQILEHDPAWLEELGLRIAPGELWSRDGGGLLEAVVQINGCSSGFVSEQGLLITNHHCAFGLLQEHSTPERDLIADGFLAADGSQELPGTGSRATVPIRFSDVSSRIESAAAGAASDLARYEAIDRAKKKLVADCEEKEFRRCRLATYDDGVRYVLIEALEFRDVRLVYAPPRWVGEFGGEVDNWMWPRHAGDFALLRVYSDGDNQPAENSGDNRAYRPTTHLKIAQQGVEPDDFVMVVGYPGRTYRSLVVAEMAERAELYFPRRAALYRDWLDIMKAQSAADEAAEIALAGRIKSLANREKNARGQVAGLERGRILEKKQAAELKVLEWAALSEDHRDAVGAYEQLTDMIIEHRASTWDAHFLLSQSRSGPKDLALALDLTRWALERGQPDMERDARYQERNRDRLLAGQRRDQSRLHAPTERELLTDFLARMAALSGDHQVSAVEELLQGDESERAIVAAVQSLSKGSQIYDLDARLEMFEQSEQQLRSRGDRMLDFAFALNRDILAMEELKHSWQGAESRLRPQWRRAAEAFQGSPLDPDANGTLRVSLAHVRGYEPRDAVWMEPLTRVDGIVQKHTGVEPFSAPAGVLEAAPDAGESRWASSSAGDVPVCFLATGDTTGGSSGSPVLNGRGELVGVNFDRVWENVANDFGYNPEIARNVSSDARYLLWILEEIEGAAAKAILDELGVELP